MINLKVLFKIIKNVCFRFYIKTEYKLGKQTPSINQRQFKMTKILKWPVWQMISQKTNEIGHIFLLGLNKEVLFFALFFDIFDLKVWEKQIFSPKVFDYRMKVHIGSSFLIKLTCWGTFFI